MATHTMVSDTMLAPMKTLADKDANYFVMTSADGSKTHTALLPCRWMIPQCLLAAVTMRNRNCFPASVMPLMTTACSSIACNSMSLALKPLRRLLRPSYGGPG